MHRRIALIALVVLTLLAAACANPATPDPTQVSQLVQQAVQATLAAQPTQPPAPTATTAAPTPIPATATSAPTLAPTAAPTSIPTVAPTNAPTTAPTTAPTAAPPSGPSVRSENVVNLRAGPGTNYPLAGTTQAGQSYNIQSRTADSGWFEICCVGERTAWVAASVVTTAGDVASVQVAKSIPTPQPLPISAPAPAAAPASNPIGQQWSLVADANADFPGGRDHSNWYYLWTEGRNNFHWQDMALPDPKGCYRDAGGLGLEVCRDTIKADPRGDVGLQWKASQGGTYRFEWDSPWLKFYKHGDFVGSQGKGSALPFSATVEGVIDWEMFFFVAGDSTPYHVRVYRLESSAGQPAAAQPQPQTVPAGRSEIGVRQEAGGIALTVLSMEKTTRLNDYFEAAPGTTFLVIDVQIENTSRDEAPYNPLYFDVQDSEGYVYDASAFAPDPDLPAGTLTRGEKVRGHVGFAVKATARGFTVGYEPLVIFGGYQKITVNLGE